MSKASEPRKLKSREIQEVREALLSDQGGLCAICEIPIKETGKVACLDHDHDAGHVRGVLCCNCNWMEGKLKNLSTRARRERTTLEWITSLVSYLTNHLTNQTGLIHPRFKTKEEIKEAKNVKRRKVQSKVRQAKHA